MKVLLRDVKWYKVLLAKARCRKVWLTYAGCLFLFHFDSLQSVSMLNGLYCTIVPNIVWNRWQSKEKPKMYAENVFTRKKRGFDARGPHVRRNFHFTILCMRVCVCGLDRFDSCSCIHNVIPFGKRCSRARIPCPLLLCHHGIAATTQTYNNNVYLTEFAQRFFTSRENEKSIVLCSLVVVSPLKKRKRSK